MNAEASPLTGVIEERNVIIDFGQYMGKTVQDIRSQDPEFFESLIREKENDNLAIRRHRDKTFRLYLNPLVAKSN